MIKRALARLRRPRFVRLKFFMRSGHSFIIDRVSEYELDATGNKVTKLRLVQNKAATGTTLIVASIDLDQIEAVVSLPR